MKTQTKSKYPPAIETAIVGISGDRGVGIMPSSLVINDLYIDLEIWETDEEKTGEIESVREQLEETFTNIYGWKARVVFGFESNQMNEEMRPEKLDHRYLTLKAESMEGRLAMTHAACSLNITSGEGEEKKRIGEVIGIVGGGVQITVKGERWAIFASTLWNSMVSALGKPELKLSPEKKEKS